MITASYKGKTATASVTVSHTLTGISLDSGAYTINDGSAHSTIVSAQYNDNTTGDVTALATYSSSNTLAGTVSAGGVVTAVGTGSAVITVTYQGKSATVYVTIN
ncbi:MAG: hypothetical protein A2189_07130 [Paenibacillus sp. RIFOXYA1_FULL_44_5]|nr:MAG: hypothetical protein A2189_07130 [Paenibacillus sp. RIFOXYA1_FULL_44_5]